MTKHAGDGAPTSALAVREFSRDEVALIKDTVARGASDTELALFLQLARTYGLDPFAKEIWCIKYGNKAATIFTSRDGYLKIANGHPAFDGIVGDVVHENDHFQLDGEGVQHQYQFPRGEIVGAYALVFRKDRSHPAYVFAPFDEYAAGNNPTWRNYPSAMILKVAEAMALKRAFSISGLVTREELDATHPADRDQQPARRPARFKGESLYDENVDELPEHVEDVEAEPVEDEPQGDPAQISLDEQMEDYKARAKKARDWLLGLPADQFEAAKNRADDEMFSWPQEAREMGAAFVGFAIDKRKQLAQMIEQAAESAADGFRQGEDPGELVEGMRQLVSAWPEWWREHALQELDAALKAVSAEAADPQAEAAS